MKAQQKETSSEEIASYYVAPEIVSQLERSKAKVVRGDQDRIFLIDGREGSGKSTLAMQLAYRIDPTFTLKDLVFNGDDLQRRIRYFAEKGIKNKVVIFDEAFNGLSSKSALSKMNKELVRLFMECRQLNLFIFIVLPSLFLLEKYVAIFRSHALFHTYVSRKDVKRRYYKVYNFKSKKTLYLIGKNMLTYTKPFIRNSYRFYGKYVPSIKKEDYLKKKIESFYEEDKIPENIKYKIQRDFFIYLCKKLSGLSYKEMEIESKGCPEPIKKSMLADICEKERKRRLIPISNIQS